MNKKFKYIFCIDDNEADLFYNRFLMEQDDIVENLIEHTEIEDAIRDLENINLKTTNDIFPSLIILDLNMPMFNGIELIEKHQSLFQSLKEKGAVTLILTTSLNPNDIKRVQENDIVDAFIQKPFKVSNIVKYLDGEEEYSKKIIYS